MSGHALRVLKFGSSVLRSRTDLPRVGTEIGRFVQTSQSVIAVVSAFEGVTDRLIAEARELGLSIETGDFAAHVSKGEFEAAGELTAHLASINLSAGVMTPSHMSLLGDGEPLSAKLIGLDLDYIQNALDRFTVIIVPGFSAMSRDGRQLLLGRGGSDMSAIYLAHKLNVPAARLIKDVDGLYDKDPNIYESALRFSRIDWQQAAEIGGVLIQPEAVQFAAGCKLDIEVARIGQIGGTYISSVSQSPQPAPERRPLRVILVCQGKLGASLLARLQAEPDRYDVIFSKLIDASKSSLDNADMIAIDLGNSLKRNPDLLVDICDAADMVRQHAFAIASGVNIVTTSLSRQKMKEIGFAALAKNARVDYLSARDTNNSENLDGLEHILQNIGHCERRLISEGVLDISPPPTLNV